TMSSPRRNSEFTVPLAASGRIGSSDHWGNCEAIRRRTSMASVCTSSACILTVRSASRSESPQLVPSTLRRCPKAARCLARWEWQSREGVEDRGESVHGKTGDRSDEGQSDAEGVGAEAEREQASLLANPARRRAIAHESLVVGRVKEDSGEREGDQEPA